MENGITEPMHKRIPSYLYFIWHKKFWLFLLNKFRICNVLSNSRLIFMELVEICGARAPRQTSASGFLAKSTSFIWHSKTRTARTTSPKNSLWTDCRKLISIWIIMSLYTSKNLTDADLKLILFMFDASYVMTNLKIR